MASRMAPSIRRSRSAAVISPRSACSRKVAHTCWRASSTVSTVITVPTSTPGIPPGKPGRGRGFSPHCGQDPVLALGAFASRGTNDSACGTNSPFSPDSGAGAVSSPTTATLAAPRSSPSTSTGGSSGSPTTRPRPYRRRASPGTAPGWISEHPGTDVLETMFWMPFVTFWQVTADLPFGPDRSQENHRGRRVITRRRPWWTANHATATQPRPCKVCSATRITCVKPGRSLRCCLRVARLRLEPTCR